MRIRRATCALAGLALAAAVAGCGTGGGDSGGHQKALQHLGKPEGQLNVLAWPGYAESGKNDPKADWVTPFEKKTGCKVNVKTFGTSDEAVNLLRSGQYDVISASGDASRRLMASGDVEPINTKLVPNYKDLVPFLKDKPFNTLDGVHYGIPHGWGANLLAYRTDKVKSKPDSWGVMFDKNSPYRGHVEAYDSPIYIADAALYLKAHQPELGIKNPYSLDKKQFQASVDLLKQQRPMISEYWSDYLKEAQSFASGNSYVGTAWQVTVNTMKKNGTPVADVLPKEGATGWSDTWMIYSKSKHQTCSYKWLNYIVSPKVNAQVAEYFGEAPANPKACDLTEDKNLCATYHARDPEFASKIAYWTTPTTKCLDGRTNVKCVDYSKWTQAWTAIKG